MFAPPLNKLKDQAPPSRTIAGCTFEPLSGKCSCGKVYSDISAAPKSAIDDQKQMAVWCHYGVLSTNEWNQIQAENERIFSCVRC
jgi:hypothetical protein